MNGNAVEFSIIGAFSIWMHEIVILSLIFILIQGIGVLKV